MTKLKLQKGVLAVCRNGHVGIIDVDEPIEKVDKCNRGSRSAPTTQYIWTGKHIWPLELFGKPWQSCNPKPLAQLTDNSLQSAPTDCVFTCYF